MNRKYALLSFVIIILFTENVNAFSCRSYKERYASAQYVFLAKILNISKLKQQPKSEYPTQNLKLEIQEVWKGKLEEKTVNAVNIVTIPGYIGHDKLKKNKTYLLSANRNNANFRN